MRTKNILLFIFMALLFSTACNNKAVSVNSTASGKIPPGQAKKMTGSKSAKPYAPGQQKKG